MPDQSTAFGSFLLSRGDICNEADVRNESKVGQFFQVFASKEIQSPSIALAIFAELNRHWPTFGNPFGQPPFACPTYKILWRPTYCPMMTTACTRRECLLSVSLVTVVVVCLHLKRTWNPLLTTSENAHVLRCDFASA